MRLNKSSPAQETSATGQQWEEVMLTGSQQARRRVPSGYLGWEDDQGRHHDAVLSDVRERPLLWLALAWQTTPRCKGAKGGSALGRGTVAPRG